MCPHTALCHPVLDASRERDRSSETEFLLKAIQSTEWEMLGWVSVHVSGRLQGEVLRARDWQERLCQQTQGLVFPKKHIYILRKPCHLYSVNPYV